MESIRELFRIGIGPSSSHTMGPKFASEMFLEKYPQAHSFCVTLYESLAATGKGHLTDWAILQVLGEERTQIIWQEDISMPEHPNAFLFQALDAEKNILGEQLYFSVGGGAIRTRETLKNNGSDIYPQTNIESIMKECKSNSMSFADYVFKHEDENIKEYLSTVLLSMKTTISNGLLKQGILPGSIELPRQAWHFFHKTKTATDKLERTGLLTAYALATSEENAGGGQVVTAPTCGACGVIPAALCYMQEYFRFKDEELIGALAVAGLFGNVVKYNATISGAEGGCQAEIGSACAMAAAGVCHLLGGSLLQVEYAAEMGLEHHLGLTCDPVDGLVQIPCIERNAYAATRAVTCAEFAILSNGEHNITFDEVTEVMKKTGKDMPSPYRETSKGGLAEIVAKRCREHNKG